MLTIGIDLGGTKCLGLAVDADGRVAGEHRLPTPNAEPTVLLDTVVATVEALRAHGEAGRVGVGAPGLVDRAGVVRFAPNLPGIRDWPLGPSLEQRLGLPVVLDNDATCAAWGECRAGAAVGKRDVVVVTLGTGIGGGIVSEGRLLRGAHGFAGEIGHTVVDPHGPPCPCGKRGCWERFASGSGLGRLGREAALAGRGARMVELAGGEPEHVRGEEVTAAAAEGDPEATAVMAQFAWWLALGLANLANTFDPEMLVLGGGLATAGELLLEPARAAFVDLVEAVEHRPPIDIVTAQLGEQAGAIGAALIARDGAA